MVLINASNLHVGGGVQVATSFIVELSAWDDIPEDLHIWVSDEVHANVCESCADLLRFRNYEVVNTYGVKLLFSLISKRLQKFDTVFTIFGPLYVVKLKGKNLLGFAQSWIINPDNEVYVRMGLVQKWVGRFRRAVQWFFFSRADALIVELEHVREGLRRRGFGSNKPVHVVSNSPSSIFLDETLWRPVEVPEKKVDFKMGFVGRNYPHKNTQIFPEIIQKLRDEYGLEVSIFVTFTYEEWLSCPVKFRSAVTNVGPLSVAECPMFYQSVDAVIFPSLLECFSATPLEALIMKKPLFASDRPFNREICGGHAVFFDPLSPQDAAKAIAKVVLNSGFSDDALSAGQMHAMKFSNPRRRAAQYLQILLGS